MPKHLRSIAAIPLLIFGPFAVVQTLLFLEYQSPWHSQVAELVFIFVGVAAGAVGFWLLPLDKWSRIRASVAYVLLMIPLTWMSALNAVCGYFGDCV
jgi:TRAP-type uncharacterized transport system fused permease subunit